MEFFSNDKKNSIPQVATVEENLNFTEKDISPKLYEYVVKIQALPLKTRMAVVDAIIAELSNNTQLFTKDMPKSLHDELEKYMEFWLEHIELATDIHNSINSLQFKAAVGEILIKNNIDKKPESVREAIKVIAKTVGYTVKTDDIEQMLKQFSRSVENFSLKYNGLPYDMKSVWKDVNKFKKVIDNKDKNKDALGNFIMMYVNKKIENKYDEIVKTHFPKMLEHE